MFYLFVIQGKGKKSKSNADTGKGYEESTYPVIKEKLKTLDVFAGCGGIFLNYYLFMPIIIFQSL